MKQVELDFCKRYENPVVSYVLTILRSKTWVAASFTFQLFNLIG